MASPGALERGDVRVRLIRELALGEQTKAQLARRYGVSRQAVGEFAARHAARIEQVAARLDDEFAGIELANKVARVAVLNDQVLADLELLADPETAAKAGVQRAEMVRVIQSGVRAIADELGQIPARVQVEHSGALDVRLNGVDLAAL